MKELTTIIILQFVILMLMNTTYFIIIKKDLTNKLEHVKIEHKIDLCIQQTNLTERVFLPCKELTQ